MFLNGFLQRGWCDRNLKVLNLIFTGYVSKLERLLSLKKLLIKVLNLIFTGYVSKLLLLEKSETRLNNIVLNLIFTGCVSKPVIFYKSFITNTYLVKML